MIRTLVAMLLWLALANPAPAEEATTKSVTGQPDAVETPEAPSAGACQRAPTKRCVLALAVVEAGGIAKENEDSTRWVFMEIARAQAEAGDVDGALATVDRIGDISNYSQIFDAVLNAQVASGDVTEILAAASRLEDSWQRMGTIIEIAEACSDAGRSELARNALKVAVSGIKPSPHLRRALFRQSGSRMPRRRLVISSPRSRPLNWHCRPPKCQSRLPYDRRHWPALRQCGPLSARRPRPLPLLVP